MFDILMVFLKDFFEKFDFEEEKICIRQKKHYNYPVGKELRLLSPTNTVLI